MEYNDDWPTCKETRVSLRIYRDDLDPDDISSRLGISPSKSQRKGDIGPGGQILPVGGWFLSSKGHVESKDAQRHVSWILDQLADKVEVIHRLQGDDYRVQLSCYWLTVQGHGGPMLVPEIMSRLTLFNLPIWFDFYCD